MTISQAQPCHCGGECCSDIPLTQSEARAILSHLGGTAADYFQTVHDQLRTKLQTISDPRGRVRVQRCIFFEPGSRLCSVYELRPRLCRAFECDGTSRQNVREARVRPS